MTQYCHGLNEAQSVTEEGDRNHRYLVRRNPLGISPTSLLQSPEGLHEDDANRVDSEQVSRGTWLGI